MFMSNNMFAENIKSMVFWLNTGKQMVLLLDNDPIITFSGNSILITTHMGAEYVFNSTDVLKYTFSDSESMGINTLLSVNASFTVDGKKIFISNITPNTTITAYNVNGTIIAQNVSNPKGEVVLSLSESPSSVCIIKTQDVSFKIKMP